MGQVVRPSTELLRGGQGFRDKTEGDELVWSSDSAAINFTKRQVGCLNLNPSDSNVQTGVVSGAVRDSR